VCGPEAVLDVAQKQAPLSSATVAVPMAISARRSGGCMLWSMKPRYSPTRIGGPLPTQSVSPRATYPWTSLRRSAGATSIDNV
jgi:hypothetical protein